MSAASAPFRHDRPGALALLERMRQRKDYIDVHCWKFSDAEFHVMVGEISDLFGLGLRVVAFRPTRPNTTEFHITLERA